MDIYFFNPTNISVGYILTKVRYRFAHLKYQWILTNSLYPERYKYMLSYTLANHIFLNILFTGWYLVLICIFTSILKYISSLNYLYIFFFSHFFFELFVFSLFLRPFHIYVTVICVANILSVFHLLFIRKTLVHCCILSFFFIYQLNAMPEKPAIPRSHKIFSYILFF